MHNDETLSKIEGVFVSSSALKKFADFETNYLSARSKEKRILTIPEIQKLPSVDPTYQHYKEWEIRKKNIFRFLNYLSKKKKTLRILDIGCGNGFFTNMMAKSHKLVGVDVNLTELKQAAEAFPQSEIHWYYLDILSESLAEANFDIITFCASFQYFDKPHELLKRCKELLVKGGEIHIIDSPFYTSDKIEFARENSRKYYRSINTEGMSNYYKHNTLNALEEYNYQIMYKPNSLFTRLLRRKDSPFPWIKISF